MTFRHISQQFRESRLGCPSIARVTPEDQNEYHVGDLPSYLDNFLSLFNTQYKTLLFCHSLTTKFSR